MAKTGFNVPRITGKTAYMLKANGRWTREIPKKQQLSNPPLIITEDHGAVTPALEMIRFRGKTAGGNTLVHFDYHHDIYNDAPDDSRVTIYRQPQNEAEARNTTAHCGNFIFSLISTGMVKDLLWVLPAFRLMMNHREAPTRQITMFPLRRAESKVPHLFADRVMLMDTPYEQGPDPLENQTYKFNFTTTLFSECRDNFPDPETPVVIDIDMDWFGVKDPDQLSFRYFPIDILDQMTDTMAYFRNIQAICIAKESKEFAFHVNKEPLLIQQLLDKGIIRLDVSH